MVAHAGYALLVGGGMPPHKKLKNQPLEFNLGLEAVYLNKPPLY